MVSAAMLLTASLAACLVLGASGLSAAAQAASSSSPECIGGTGAPLPPASATAGAAGCHGYTAPTPTNAPTPLALEPGALPVVQALPSASADLSAGLAPLVQTPGSRESFYWYSLFATKTEPQENCWQTGVLGASSYACDSVGASYLPNGPHMHEISEQGAGEDFQISPSGDYCNYYRLGESLNTTNGNKQSGNTGYEPPTPLSSYQEGNSHISPPNVCQAYETFWGQVLQGSGNSKCDSRPPCGMQHYVSLHEQGGNDRPWGSSFGEPSLVISDDVLPYSLGTHGGAWGYLCPLFEDQTPGTGGDILEYCLEEWRVGSGQPSTNEHFDVVSACNSGGNPVHNLDQTITQFASGTSFAENIGSQTTFVFEPSKESKKEWRDFSARITPANLENAINADRRNHPFSETEREEAEKDKRSWSEQGCGRNLSTKPANYALIGIEQGVEGEGLSEIGASDANLQLWTEYTPLVPPTVSTGTASGVQFKRATLNGTVNPNGDPTNYYFQYGETTSYGSAVPAGGAGVGSGTETVPVSNTATGLNPGTTYHYRLVAENAGGQATYGSDHVFTTATPPSLSISKRFQSSMTLSWTGSANASSYTIKRNGETITSATALEYVDTKLQPTTFYDYEVVANEENESAGSSAVTRATTPLNTIKADVNGDGKTDLVYIYPGGYIDTFLSKGNGTYEEKSELKEKGFDSTSGLWLASDFNGDGKTDLVYIYPGGYIDTFLSKGNGEYEDKSEHLEGFDSGSGKWLTGDANGDGKTDLFYIYPGSYIDTFLSKGNGTYESKSEHLEGFDSGSGQWRTGDANGDGKTDLFYIYPGSYIDTFLSKGNGTYESKSEHLEGFDSGSGVWL
jgi:hypothetical protein